MKPGFIIIFSLLIILGVFPKEISAQAKFQIGIKSDFYSFPVNKNTSDLENAKYEIDGRPKTNEAIYIETNWWLSKTMGLNFGVGLHSFNYESYYKIPDPFFEEKDEFNEYRIMNAISWGPSLGILWRNEKFKCKLGLTIFDPFKFKESHSSSEVVYTFLSPDRPSFQIGLDEDIALSMASEDILGQFTLEYMVVKNLWIHTGIERTVIIGGRFYSLRILEFNNSNPQGGTPVNDFKMHSGLTSIKLGASYYFDLGTKRDIN